MLAFVPLEEYATYAVFAVFATFAVFAAFAVFAVWVVRVAVLKPVFWIGFCVLMSCNMLLQLLLLAWLLLVDSTWQWRATEVKRMSLLIAIALA